MSAVASSAVLAEMMRSQTRQQLQQLEKIQDNLDRIPSPSARTPFGTATTCTPMQTRPATPFPLPPIVQGVQPEQLWAKLVPVANAQTLARTRVSSAPQFVSTAAHANGAIMDTAHQYLRAPYAPSLVHQPTRSTSTFTPYARGHSSSASVMVPASGYWQNPTVQGVTIAPQSSYTLVRQDLQLPMPTMAIGAPAFFVQGQHQYQYQSQHQHQAVPALAGAQAQPMLFLLTPRESGPAASPCACAHCQSGQAFSRHQQQAPISTQRQQHQQSAMQLVTVQHQRTPIPTQQQQGTHLVAMQPTSSCFCCPPAQHQQSQAQLTPPASAPLVPANTNFLPSAATSTHHQLCPPPSQTAIMNVGGPVSGVNFPQGQQTVFTAGAGTHSKQKSWGSISSASWESMSTALTPPSIATPSTTTSATAIMLQNSSAIPGDSAQDLHQEQRQIFAFSAEDIAALSSPVSCSPNSALASFQDTTETLVAQPSNAQTPTSDTTTTPSDVNSADNETDFVDNQQQRFLASQLVPSLSATVAMAIFPFDGTSSSTPTQHLWQNERNQSQPLSPSSFLSSQGDASICTERSSRDSLDMMGSDCGSLEEGGDMWGGPPSAVLEDQELSDLILDSDMLEGLLDALP